VKVMDGGRKKWEDEGRPIVHRRPVVSPDRVPHAERDDEKIRAFREDVLEHVKGKGQLVDVRSPEEFRGEKLHMPDYPQEGAVRGGHIPGARRACRGRAP
jgi:thiosulfate/3-mercaptopyruvate sulfurtransferase